METLIMSNDDKNPAPAAGRAATVRPNAESEKRNDRNPADKTGEASPGAAADKSQAEEKPA